MNFFQSLVGVQPVFASEIVIDKLDQRTKDTHAHYISYILAKHANTIYQLLWDSDIKRC